MMTRAVVLSAGLTLFVVLEFASGSSRVRLIVPKSAAIQKRVQACTGIYYKLGGDGDDAQKFQSP